ncbi:MAG TPA: MBL fold metallo-hydrolase [Mycobacteriales bacterium]|jgi:glyoxylase-like metal-dependent hydrolase (beta-lactamase superfamily II)|nr:MBL fold metallo-hydrolase [Mycobacteriales bacterium]
MTWTEPGAFPVAPGVHRIPLPLPDDGLKAVNVYTLETADGLVLVDGGWALPAAREVLVAGLSQIGAQLGDIRRFLVTHAHRDHYTQAVTLRRETGAVVALGAGERPTLERMQEPDRNPLDVHLDLLRRLGAGERADRMQEALTGHPFDRDVWELPDQWLPPGEVPLPGGRVLEAVPTPGHTTGHLVFHDLAAGLLFAGDHVLPTITPSIGFEPVLSADPLGAFLRSLALVRARPDAVLLPAHGEVRDSVHARVDELVAHHGRRLDDVHEAATGTGEPAAAVATRLLWTRHGRSFADLDGFNAMLAIFETGAHLDLLALQGRLAREDVDGVLRYR